jgi:hypothetical protein
MHVHTFGIVPSPQSWSRAVAWVLRSVDDTQQQLADLIREKWGGPRAPNPRQATPAQLRRELAALRDPRTLIARARFVELARAIG